MRAADNPAPPNGRMRRDHWSRQRTVGRSASWTCDNPKCEKAYHYVPHCPTRRVCVVWAVLFAFTWAYSVSLLIYAPAIAAAAIASTIASTVGVWHNLRKL